MLLTNRVLRDGASHTWTDSANEQVRGSQKGGFQKGGFGGCSPGTKTGTRVRSPKPPFYETALLSPSEPFWCSQKGGFQKGGFGGCSPGTKTGTRVRSPKPPFYETALFSPSERGIFGLNVMILGTCQKARSSKKLE